MIEVLKQALDAFEDLKKNHRIVCVNEIVDLRKAIAELESQEPVGWWDVKLGFFNEKHFDQLQPLYTTPPQRTEQNFCPRCGKRTKDLTHIHTCTPPKEKT
jgi:hypothetical protein